MRKYADLDGGIQLVLDKVAFSQKTKFSFLEVLLDLALSNDAQVASMARNAF